MSSFLLPMAGGLGLFLYGMKLMSDGLEKAAGARLRGILEFFTTNRFSGDAGRNLLHSHHSVVQCLHGYGRKLRKRRPYESVTGQRA